MMRFYVTNGGVIRISYLFLGVFLISSRTEAVSVSVHYQTQDLGKRDIEDKFTPYDPPFRWSALGDSYTAGPGAGQFDPSDDGKCARSNGSYAPQLQKDWPYSGDRVFNFTACSGAKTPQVLEKQIPTISNEPALDLVVLTIGGNDVGFGKIIKSCLMNLIGSGNCDDRIKTARTTFQSNEFRDNLDKIYNNIFDKMPADFHYQIIQLGYSKFFNAYDDSTWCNDKSFGRIPTTLRPPQLTLELRRKLNLLTDEFNIALWTHILGYANQKLQQDKANDKGWLVNRIFFGSLDGDKDLSFEGHRFCEKGIEDTKFQDPSTWFFGVWGKQDDTVVTASYFGKYDASKCASDPQYEEDEVYAFECDMAIYYASPGADQNAPTITGSDFLRSFHPKTVGFTNVKQYLSDKMTAVRVTPDQGTCVQTPQNVDLNALNASQEGFPASLCATGNNFTTGLGPAPTTAAPPTTSATASPTIAAVDPPFKSSCVPAPSNGSTHHDSHQDTVSRAAEFFCRKYASPTAVPTGPPVRISQDVVSGPIANPRGPPLPVAGDYSGTTAQDDVYTFQLDSVDGCVPQGGVYNLATPLGNHTDKNCAELLRNAWSECNNEGRGGSYAAGCLLYGLSTKY